MPCSNNGHPASQRTLLSPSELAVLNLTGFRMDEGCIWDAGSAGGSMPQAGVSDWIEKGKGGESWAPASLVSDFWLDLKGPDGQRLFPPTSTPPTHSWLQHPLSHEPKWVLLYWSCPCWNLMQQRRKVLVFPFLLTQWLCLSLPVLCVKELLKSAPMNCKWRKGNIFLTQVIHPKYQRLSLTFSIQRVLQKQERFVLKIANHFQRPRTKNTRKWYKVTLCWILCLSWHRMELEQRVSVTSSQGVDTVETAEALLLRLPVSVLSFSVCLRFSLSAFSFAAGIAMDGSFQSLLEFSYFYRRRQFERMTQ